MSPASRGGRDRPSTTAPTVLLSVDEGHGSLAAARALVRAGFRTWVACWREDTYAARSRAIEGAIEVTSPYADPELHARELAGAARLLGADASLPGTESSLRALTGREHLFGDETVVGTPSAEALDRATDKRFLDLVASEGGPATPPSFTVRSSASIPAGLRLPAIVKPPRSVNENGDGMDVGVARIVRDPGELKAALDEDAGEPKLVQPHLPGTLGAISGVAMDGEVICAVHQRSPRIWPPSCGISCFAETVAPSAEREDAVRRLIERVGWSGIFEAQFILGEDESWLIDLNPRVYGSIGLAIHAGANLPGIWAAKLLGLPIVTPRYRPGARFRAEEDDPRALLHDLRTSGPRALAGALPRRRTVHAVFSMRDLAPFRVSAAKLAARVRRPKRTQRDRASSPSMV